MLQEKKVGVCKILNIFLKRAEKVNLRKFFFRM